MMVRSVCGGPYYVPDLYEPVSPTYVVDWSQVEMKKGIKVSRICLLHMYYGNFDCVIKLCINYFIMKVSSLLAPISFFLNESILGCNYIVT